MEYVPIVLGDNNYVVVACQVFSEDGHYSMDDFGKQRGALVGMLATEQHQQVLLRDQHKIPSSLRRRRLIFQGRTSASGMFPWYEMLVFDPASQLWVWRPVNWAHRFTIDDWKVIQWW